MAGSVRTSVEVPIKPTEAFDVFVDELYLGLEGRGLRIDRLSRGGRISEAEAEVGVVTKWLRGKGISIQWHPRTWEKGTTELKVLFSRAENGTRITVESVNWGSVLEGNGRELLGWYAGEVVASLFSASTPKRLGDWVTDRHARRPFGENSRKVYSNPVHHWPNFLAILRVLHLNEGDNLVEVGCGGGAFLQEALKSGCRASAIDHSTDMVRLATRTNRSSVERGVLKVEVGDAGRLPYQDGTFTCAVMTGVLGFLPDPASAFGEVFRVLQSGGRFVAFTSTKEIRGTPAAPEPIASRVHFYEDTELENLARIAGFGEVRVDHPSLFGFAKRAGVPKSDIDLFRGTSGSQLLVCRKG